MTGLFFHYCKSKSVLYIFFLKQRFTNKYHFNLLINDIGGHWCGTSGKQDPIIAFIKEKKTINSRSVTKLNLFFLSPEVSKKKKQQEEKKSTWCLLRKHISFCPENSPMVENLLYSLSTNTGDSFHEFS